MCLIATVTQTFEKSWSVCAVVFTSSKGIFLCALVNICIIHNSNDYVQQQVIHNSNDYVQQQTHAVLVHNLFH